MHEWGQSFFSYSYIYVLHITAGKEGWQTEKTLRVYRSYMRMYVRINTQARTWLQYRSTYYEHICCCCQCYTCYIQLQLLVAFLFFSSRFHWELDESKAFSRLGTNDYTYVQSSIDPHHLKYALFFLPPSIQKLAYTSPILWIILVYLLYYNCKAELSQQGICKAKARWGSEKRFVPEEGWERSRSRSRSIYSLSHK